MANILVIDDDVLMGKALRRLLENEGHTVFLATNGIEALTILRDNRAELMITDIFMPDQDGISTIIDAREAYPGMKIIAISGGGRRQSVDYLELAHNLGAHRIFSKPFKDEDFLESIQELLA